MAEIVGVDLLKTAPTDSAGELLLDVAIMLQDRRLDSLPIGFGNIGPANGTAAIRRQPRTHTLHAEGRVAAGRHNDKVDMFQADSAVLFSRARRRIVRSLRSMLGRSSWRRLGHLGCEFRSKWHRGCSDRVHSRRELPSNLGFSLLSLGSWHRGTGGMLRSPLLRLNKWGDTAAQIGIRSWSRTRTLKFKRLGAF